MTQSTPPSPPPPPSHHGPTDSKRKVSSTAVVVMAAVLALVIGGIVGAAAVMWMHRSEGPAAANAPAKTIWTCSMHPQIRRDGPGQCPICGMDLIPASEVSGSAKAPDAPTLVSTAEAVAMMDIQTAPVERKFVPAEIRMVGKIAYDETRLASITAWVPGRLDRLFVDYTGVPVRKGDHMVELYSPDLLSAQEELIQAKRAVGELSGSGVGIVRQTTEATLIAAREKLRLLGLTPEQVQAIETGGKTSDHVTIYSPASGIVVDKNGREGMYVQTGMRIYTIADLSVVWVQFGAYESDLVWLKYGQRVSFTAEAYPGREFSGTIAFIDPVLTDRTRTVKVRVNATNADGALKPGMFVRAVVRSRIAAGGRVIAPDLAGKWICPMHPSVIKADAGTCDICGMPLVRTESLGYAAPEAGPQAAPLVIPVSAVLKTGTRAVVYVKDPSASVPTFHGRVIDLGPRAGDYYLVEGGLKESELVVTRGNFKIDSALQIQAKPSMMSPAAPAEAPTTEPAGRTTLPAGILQYYSAATEAYFSMQAALAGDDAAAALNAATGMRESLSESLKYAQANETPAWRDWAAKTLAILDDALKAKGIEPLRGAFAMLSEQFISAVPRFTEPARAVYQLHCPMAFNNRGADWLQKSPEVHNPYFGAAMPRCGEIQRTFEAADTSHE